MKVNIGLEPDLSINQKLLDRNSRENSPLTDVLLMKHSQNAKLYSKVELLEYLFYFDNQTFTLAPLFHYRQINFIETFTLKYIYIL